MLGMDMMMKSLGLDPNLLLAKAQEFTAAMQSFSARADEIAALCRDTNARVARMETEMTALRLAINGMAQSRGALANLDLPDVSFAGEMSRHPIYASSSDVAKVLQFTPNVGDRI
jgi:outer membrane murein-binding lipoprotein Lpp